MNAPLASFKRFIRNTSGMTIPLLAITLVVLLGAAGLAVDIARKQLVQSRLSSAIDAAGLAAAATLSSTDDDLAEVRKYLAINFPENYMGAGAPDITVDVAEDNTTLTINASVKMPTILMGILGQHTMNAAVSTEIRREGGGVEVVMVLDNTGSMNEGGKLENLKAAAKTMVTSLHETGASNLWIGLVPFGQAVNIGTGHMAWVNSTYAPGTPNVWPTNDQWKGCVEDRYWNTGGIGSARAPLSGGMDTSEAPPVAGHEETLFWQYYNPCTNDSQMWDAAGNSCTARCTGTGQVWNSTTQTCDCTSQYIINGNNTCSSRCGANMTWNGSACVCVSAAYYIRGENCVAYCPGSNSTWNGSACVCRTGYTNVNGVCRAICTGSNTVWNGNTCECRSNQYYKSGPNCFAYCGSHSTWNGTTCVCDYGYSKNASNVCVANCESHSTWNGSTCVCDYGYSENGSSVCVAICGSNSTWNGTACVCNYGYHEDASVCVPYCTASYTLWNGSTCVCYDNYHKNGRGECVPNGPN